MAGNIRVGSWTQQLHLGGSWGVNAHVPALRALLEFEVKAVCTGL